MAANRAVPVLALSTGSKNFSPRGMVPWGRITTSSPASRARWASRSGWSDPAAPVHADPAEGPGDGTDHRGVEQLALGQEAHGRPSRAATMARATTSK
jgi:hypothetical protein